MPGDFKFGGKIYRSASGRAANSARACAHQKRAFAEVPERKKNERYLRKYGISLVDFDLLFTKQQRCCGICKSPDPVSPHWHVDHDHKKSKGDPGFVRGILCFLCNAGGGKFRDDPVLLRAAADWFAK